MSWLLWLFLAALLVLPVILRFCAEDHPRNDEPPDADDPGPAALHATA